MNNVEIWRGLSHPFENGAGHKTGGNLMRAVYSKLADEEWLTFEIEDGVDAMGAIRWKRSERLPSQLLINLAGERAAAMRD